MTSVDDAFVVVLAAGASTRFGSDKLQAHVDGRPLLELTIDAVLEVVEPTRVLVVVGPEHDARAQIAAARGVGVCTAEHSSRGMRWSIDAGLAALPGDSAGAVLVLADDPLAVRALAAVVDAAQAEPARIIAVTRGGGAPHPVWLPRATWPDAEPHGDDDTGLRSLLQGDVTWLSVPAAPSFDVDRPDDVVALEPLIARVPDA
jgi:molybdenum cofactor cytidylyltransferase